jgi:Mn2+/Fe2+ NRAMP family transporter
MNTELQTWLRQATRSLSRDSAAQVRTEIQDHYESARDAAMSGGSSEEEAKRVALAALGNAQAANCQYRSVLLTSAEARMLREGNWEARAVCSRPWLKRSLLAIPVILLCASATLFLTGALDTARVLLTGAIVMSLLLVPPFLPLYTPSRARVLRAVKWAALVGIMGLAFQWSWLLIACLWPLAWVEWKRISIRRKLPVADWPKQLYL